MSLFAVTFTAFCGMEVAAAAAADSDWDKLLKANKEFVRNPEFAKERAGLVNGQNPHIVILSCSDSRVPPEIIFEQSLGDLFCTRIAGNIEDAPIVDSMEFAVGNYDVTTVIVMGHSDCGAVEGALARLRKNHGKIDHIEGDHLNAILIPIEIAIVDAGIDIFAHNALELSIKANVKYVVQQLLKRSPVISKAVKDRQIIIVGAEYILKSGRVQQLFILNDKGFHCN